MSERKSTAVQIIPILIRDIHSNLQPVGDIHKFFGVKFYDGQIHGWIVDTKSKATSVKVVLDDGTGRIAAFLKMPNNYKELKEKEPTYEYARKSLTEEESFQRLILQSPNMILGSRATITGRPRKSGIKYINSYDFILIGASITIDDGPDRKKEIEFRKGLVDFYTKQLNRC